MHQHHADNTAPVKMDWCIYLTMTSKWLEMRVYCILVFLLWFNTKCVIDSVMWPWHVKLWPSWNSRQHMRKCVILDYFELVTVKRLILDGRDYIPFEACQFESCFIKIGLRRSFGIQWAASCFYATHANSYPHFTIYCHIEIDFGFKILKRFKNKTKQKISKKKFIQEKRVNTCYAMIKSNLRYRVYELMLRVIRLDSRDTVYHWYSIITIENMSFFNRLANSHP